MSVLLSWSNANAALASSINVYRSTTPLDVNNLPAALTTLAGSATSYTDTTAVKNTIYYYAVGMVRSGQELVCKPFTMGHFPDTGPGPTTILRGDWNLGYFGLATPAQMFTPSGLAALITVPGTMQADGNLTGWHKFIRQGKILYIPNNAISTGMQFYQLYNAGLVFGTNDNGTFPFTPSPATINGYTAPANQYKTVVKGSYTFIVRAPRASNKPQSGYVTLPADAVGSEWSDLFGRLGVTALAASPQDKWNDVVPASLNNYCFSPYWTAQSSIVSCGASASAFDAIAPIAIQSGGTTLTYFLPVLEYVPA